MKKIYPVFYISVIGMVAVAVISMIYIVVKDMSVGIFLLGALSWIISYILKLIWAGHMNKKIFKMLKAKLGNALSKVVSWSYIGILTGIFECGLVLAFVYFIPVLNQAEWPDILSFGIGFGAVEALYMGLSYLLYLIGSKYTAEPDDRLAVTKNNLLLIPVATVERISTLFVHLYSCVLIFVAVQENAYSYFWLSFAFKTLVDGIAGWLILEKDARKTNIASQQWSYQIIFAILGLIGLYGTIKLTPL